MTVLYQTVDQHEKRDCSYDLVVWFIQVIIVLVFCIVVIRACLMVSPPNYTITDLSTVPATRGGNDITQNHTMTTVVFSLVIENPNKNKGILYHETKVTLYRNDLVLGGSLLSRFYQGGRSSILKSVLINVNGLVVGENGTLRVGLETMVRYRILNLTTKQHSLNLEASLNVDKHGRFSIQEEGVKLKPLK